MFVELNRRFNALEATALAVATSALDGYQEVPLGRGGVPYIDHLRDPEDDVMFEHPPFHWSRAFVDLLNDTLTGQDMPLRKKWDLRLDRRRLRRMPYRLVGENSVCLCHGTGLDSTLASYYLLRQQQRPAVALWVDYGQRTADREREYLAEWGGGPFDTLFTMDLRALYEGVLLYPKHEETGLEFLTTIPLRNLIFCCIAGSIADEIWIATYDPPQHRNPMYDGSYEFMHAMSMVLTEFYGRHIKVTAPFGRSVKWRAVKRAIDEGWVTGNELFEDSYTCLHGIKNNCGECIDCFQKWRVLKMAGFDSTDLFETTPDWVADPERMQAYERTTRGPEW